MTHFICLIAYDSEVYRNTDECVKYYWHDQLENKKMEERNRTEYEINQLKIQSDRTLCNKKIRRKRRELAQDPSGWVE